MNSQPQMPLHYPGTRTWVNKPGFRDPNLLAAFERSATTARLVELYAHPVRPTLDLKHIQEIHRRLFQDVYPWAGQLRTEAIPTSGQFTIRSFFAPTAEQSVKEYGESVLERLRQPAMFRPEGKEEFVTNVAGFYDLISYWHPFHSGNDRMLRIFINQAAQSAGYRLDFSRTDHPTLAHALYATEMDDRGPLRAMFRAIATPQRAHVFSQALAKGDERGALIRHPELKPTFAILKDVRERLGHDPGLAPSSVRLRRYENVVSRLQRELDSGRVPQDASDKTVMQLLWMNRNLER